MCSILLINNTLSYSPLGGDLYQVASGSAPSSLLPRG